ncbi:MAG: STAS domain-containing protein [Candidatus Omnitrophica bacterium]|nr:STAS domain-containing protein [Candidatus Omnitrophota bacterium]
MDVLFKDRDGIMMAEIQGEINISTSPQLKKDFEKVTAPKVVINLAKVGYVDSSGLATLVEILKRARARGGTVCLTHLTDKVRSLFEITKLDKLFNIQADDQAALAQLK